MELSRRQELYYKKEENDVVGQQKQKARSTLDDEYVGTWDAFMHQGVTFYGIVTHCYRGNRHAKTWYMVYDNNDSEDVLLPELRNRQNLYAREGIYDILGNPNQPAI